MSRRTRLGLLVATLSVALLATACAAPSIPNPLAKQPVITPQQARVTFLRLESQRTLAIHDRSRKALAGVETGQALINDVGEIETAANGWDDDWEGGPFGTVKTLAPRITRYPAWFVAETHSSQGRVLDVLTQQGPHAPWLLSWETLSTGPVPRVSEQDGYAVPATFDRNLSSDVATYFEHGVSRKPTQFVLPGPDTSQLVATYLKDISSEESGGWSYGFTFVSGGFDRSEGLSLANGGSLGFANYRETYAVAQKNGSCFYQDPRTLSDHWTELGSPGELRSLTATQVVTALVVETRKGDRVIGEDWNYSQLDVTGC